MKDEDGIIPAAQQRSDTSEGLLARWSRRKREASQTAETAPPTIQEAAGHDPDDEAQAEPELTDADMPPIESLTEDSDYSVFLSPRVSETLRQQALQKLFGLNRFNVCDGLDDYAEDFTNFAGLGDIVTHEMRRMLEKQKEKLTEAVAGTEEPSTREGQGTTTKPPVESGQTPDQASNTALNAENKHNPSKSHQDPEIQAQT